MPLLGYSTLVNQTYQCLGFSFWASMLAMCRQGFSFPLVLLLPGIVGITGIQVAVQPAADLLTFVASVPFQVAFFAKNLPRDQA